MSGIVSSKASSMTEVMSGASDFTSEFVCKEYLSSINFNSNNTHVVLHILIANVMNINEEILC